MIVMLWMSILQILPGEQKKQTSYSGQQREKSVTIRRSHARHPSDAIPCVRCCRCCRRPSRTLQSALRTAILNTSITTT
jgi:hypothetical protein